VLHRAQALGLIVWVATGALLGWSVARVDRVPAWGKLAAFATLGLSVPVAAYAVSGMETPLATSLATGAVIAYRRPTVVALLAGLAASFRPEMAPWAFVIAVAVPIATKATPTRAVLSGAFALVPFSLCALVRAVAWGHPAPLALLAKPGQLGQGVDYAVVACLVSLLPLLALAPVALARTPVALAIVAAAIAHVGAVVWVGGDWMPFARLMVPVVPSLLLAAVMASRRAHRSATALRAVAAIGVGIALFRSGRRVVDDGRRTMAERTALIESSRAVLAGASCVVGLDIGWLGAATEADIVDLAGLTDPEIAALPGGHTSKRVDAALLLARHPDALVLFAPKGLPPGGLSAFDVGYYSRAVEARLARDAAIAAHFEPAAWLPLGQSGAGYVVLRTIGWRGGGPA
jgi:hypothetical protein